MMIRLFTLHPSYIQRGKAELSLKTFYSHSLKKGLLIQARCPPLNKQRDSSRGPNKLLPNASKGVSRHAHTNAAMQGPKSQRVCCTRQVSVQESIKAKHNQNTCSGNSESQELSFLKSSLSSLGNRGFERDSREEAVSRASVVTFDPRWRSH